MITNFNPVTFQVVKVLKRDTVFLIEQDGKRAVLKREAAAIAGTGKGDERYIDLRRRWVESHENQSPQVTRSIDIAAEIFSYVTNESTASQIKALKHAQVSVAVRRLPGEKQDYQESDYKFYIGNTWYLMPCYNSLANLDDRPFPRSLLDALKTQPQAFESLGRVLVCDMFLCNIDRIGPLHPHFNTKNATTVLNPGNLMLTWYPLRFLGLDFMDTQNSDGCYMGASWQSTSAHLQDGRSAAWADALLYNFGLLRTGKHKLRDAAAKYALAAVGTCFEPKVAFGKAAEKALREGIRNGRDRLKQFYDDGVSRQRWPLGLESRFKACGW